MKFLKSLILALLLALFAQAGAQVQNTGTATLTWEHNLRNTDGTALTNLAGFRIVHGASQTELTQSINVPNAAARSYTVTNLPAGTRYFGVIAYTSTGTDSAVSNIVSKSIAGATTPAPPTLRVADTTVYTVLKRPDAFVMLAVGTVPANTACITTERVNDYYVVPRAAVTWSGTVRPDVVVAQCN
jgi:hypothetical protein